MKDFVILMAFAIGFALFVLCAMWLDRTNNEEDDDDNDFYW